MAPSAGSQEGEVSEEEKSNEETLEAKVERLESNLGILLGIFKDHTHEVNAQASMQRLTTTGPGKSGYASSWRTDKRLRELLGE